jgi:hypothetical protein
MARISTTTNPTYYIITNERTMAGFHDHPLLASYHCTSA